MITINKLYLNFMLNFIVIVNIFIKHIIVYFIILLILFFLLKTKPLNRLILILQEKTKLFIFKGFGKFLLNVDF